MSYNPFNWYWKRDDGVIYASQRQTLIGDDDEIYIEFLNSGDRATRWPENEEGEQTDLALQEVLSQFGLIMYPPTLDELKAELRMTVDAAAEVERARYVTPGSGQAMTYRDKLNELVRYEADTNPVKVDYPILSAEIGITGTSLVNVATKVRSAVARSTAGLQAIDIVRLQAKANITKASTEAAARSAAEAVWPASP